MKGELLILDRSGHRTVSWDTAEGAGLAREAMQSLQAEGYLAYVETDKAGNGTVVKDFDAEAERIVLAPPLVGG
jgi:hypothetical protein